MAIVFYLKNGSGEKLGVAPDELIFGNGSNEIIELAVRAFMRPGDQAVMARQAFVVYQLIVQAVGGMSVQVPLRDFTHDLGAIAAAVTAETKIVFLANPNNPTGTIYRRAEWERFSPRLPEEVLLIVDEAYFEYVQDAGYPDSLKYQQGRPCSRCGPFPSSTVWLACASAMVSGPEIIIDLMQRVRQPFNVNAPAQWAALAALDDGDHVRRSLALNREGLEFLGAEFKQARSGVRAEPRQFHLGACRQRPGSV